ncbi:MAG: type II toxin-antitoxin system HicB family antitoxin [Candidatus Nitronauta litoralis]|uniref:Type II toxin-antitoxin system HicB family antitoxin n=1 Tax=Candidatus Nitronauta litoralis TaxID=2705533 RepID=A0A7T0BWQ2_9BACT|nr:MAG: type II toxin-antitoxin system HicB family antitoxin [Candidatus Nitronauta litoralis]
MKKDHRLFSKNISPEELNVIVEIDDEGFYVASVVELPGCHTLAKSFEGLMNRLKEAVSLYIDVEGPPEMPSRFVGAFRIPI